MRNMNITCDACGKDCTSDFYAIFRFVNAEKGNTTELCPECYNKTRGVCPVCGSGMNGGVFND